MTDFQDRLQRALDADFLIERELGGGGMSRVFLATERALQRRVVVKVLPPDLAAGVNVERFRREIQLAAQLQHPHIVPVLAAGDDDALLWYTMPYIDGESLRGALTRQKRLPVRDVVRILHDVVDALAYAHVRGVVHRDIKPDNILTSGMHALVTDFGVAKALSAAIPLAGGTTTGMAIGTPAYMAPEQLAADPAADHRVDLYAVGLLGYELLTGTSPFTGTSPQATLAAQLTVTPPSPHTALPDIPVALSNVIMHCLEKDANKRPASAQALLAELDALPPLTGRQASGGSTARSRAWVAIPVGVAVLAASYLIAQRDRSPARASATADATDLAARDAAAGGSRTPGMSVAARDSALADSAGRADNGRPAFRDGETELSSVDGTRAVAVPIVITRAESLAIADAMLKRMASGTSGAANNAGTNALATKVPATADSKVQRVFVRTVEDPTAELSLDREALLAEVRRIFTDSIALAIARMDAAMARLPRNVRMEPPAPGSPAGVVPLIAPPTDGRTRVVVSTFANGTGRRELGNVGRDVAQFVRAGLPTDKYDVVNAEITERAARGGLDRIALGWGLRADFVVSGVVSLRGDSLVVVTMFNDVRDGRFVRASELATPVADPHAAFDASLSHVSAWLDTARVTRTRRPSMSPRPGGAPPDYRNR